MEGLGDSARITRLLSRLGLIVAAIAWAFLLWRATDVFRPDSALQPTYNSDLAIPLLMADEPRATPFSLYYYGQDRYGAWPFLLAHLLGRVVHFSWSPERLSVWLTLFMFSAAWPLWWLVGKRDLIVPSYLGVLLLDPVVQVNREPYGWQAATLIWTWWSLRQLSSGRNSRFWLAAACLGSMLAVWISPLSGAILLVLVTLEWAFTRRKNFLIMLIPPAIGIGVERLLRAWFHQYARLNFHNSYEIPLELDQGHLLQNFSAMWNALRGRPWWIVQVGAVLVGAYFLLSWVTRRLRKSGTHAGSQNPWRALAIGCAATCVLAFVASVATSHVRDNLYNERYLTPVFLFGEIGGVAAVIALLPIRRISARARNGLSLALTLVVTATIALRLPPSTINSVYPELKAAADWLANQPVPAVLGGYWGTYVFSGLAVPKKVIPIPVEEDYQRTPWTGSAIHQARQVVVSTYKTDRFGPANHPDRWVTDRGEFFQRVETPSWSNGVVTFWTYLSATERAIPISGSSVLNWNACGEESLSIDVGSLRSAELVYWFQPPRPTIQVVGQSEHGGKRAPDAVEDGTRMIRYVFENGAPISRVILQPIGQRNQCLLEALTLFNR